jgi:hypothetical protein
LPTAFRVELTRDYERDTITVSDVHALIDDSNVAPKVRCLGVTPNAEVIQLAPYGIGLNTWGQYTQRVRSVPGAAHEVIRTSIQGNHLLASRNTNGQRETYVVDTAGKEHLLTPYPSGWSPKIIEGESVSHDGKTVFGERGDYPQGVIWREAIGWRTFDEYMTELGLSTPGWISRRSFGSADGTRAFVYQQTTDYKQRRYIAVSIE